MVHTINGIVLTEVESENPLSTENTKSNRNLSLLAKNQ